MVTVTALRNGEILLESEQELGELLTVVAADARTELLAKDLVDLSDSAGTLRSLSGRLEQPHPPVAGVGNPPQKAGVFEAIDLASGRRPALGEVFGGTRLVDRPELDDIGEQRGCRKVEPQFAEPLIVDITDLTSGRHEGGVDAHPRRRIQLMTPLYPLRRCRHNRM